LIYSNRAVIYTLIKWSDAAEIVYNEILLYLRKVPTAGIGWFLDDDRKASFFCYVVSNPCAVLETPKSMLYTIYGVNTCSAYWYVAKLEWYNTYAHNVSKALSLNTCDF